MKGGSDGGGLCFCELVLLLVVMVVVEVCVCIYVCLYVWERARDITHRQAERTVITSNLCTLKSHRQRYTCIDSV